jgi:hypothetical protein
VCTKNQASYERRVRQRKKDLDDLARREARNDVGDVSGGVIDSA